jgi:hypothetical protein
MLSTFWTNLWQNTSVSPKTLMIFYVWKSGLIFSNCEQNVPIKIAALINDTTGTLIASSYVDKTTKIGVIFGTGCNAAYMEKLSNIPKLKHLGLPDDVEMAINCEVCLPVSGI